MRLFCGVMLFGFLNIVSVYFCLKLLVSFRTESLSVVLCEPKVSSSAVCRSRCLSESLFYVAACFSREGPYLWEWVTHYVELGFHRVVLLDSNTGSQDMGYIEAVTKHFPCVTVVGNRDRPFSVNVQASFYNKVYSGLRPIDWCLFVDIDEFFTLKELSLARFVQMAEGANCSQVKLNWLTYGNNGHVSWTSGGVLERFPRPVWPVTFTVRNMIWNGHVKSFVRGGRRANFRNVHSMVGSGLINCNGNLKCVPLSSESVVIPPVFDLAFVKHFWCKSQEEYEEKIFQRWKGRQSAVVDWQYYNTINANAPNVPYVHCEGRATGARKVGI